MTRTPTKRIEFEMKENEPRGRTFEASLAALEKIVRQLEQGDLPLEESLKLFEQGVALSRECQERLNQAERRIETLLRDSEGKSVISSFEEPNDLPSSRKAEPEQDESVF
jgi:exodeoxyribonuclease VII small subunit